MPPWLRWTLAEGVGERHVEGNDSNQDSNPSPKTVSVCTS
jgi:hypothetical protein